jgi:hypothetical protein
MLFLRLDDDLSVLDNVNYISKHRGETVFELVAVNDNDISSLSDFQRADYTPFQNSLPGKVLLVDPASALNQAKSMVSTAALWFGDGGRRFYHFRF